MSRAEKITKALLIALVLLTLILQANLRSRPTIPTCQEDVVLVGVGDFEHGQWTAYECGPAVDDFMEE